MVSEDDETYALEQAARAADGCRRLQSIGIHTFQIEADVPAGQAEVFRDALSAAINSPVTLDLDPEVAGSAGDPSLVRLVFGITGGTSGV